MKLVVKNTPGLTLPSNKTDHVFWDDEIPGLGVRVRAGGSRMWVFQYAIGGKHRRMTLGAVTKESFSTLKDSTGAVIKLGVREQAALLHARVRLGEDPAGVKAENRQRAKETFGAIAERFLAYQKEQLRPGSYRQVERHIRLAKSLHGTALASVDRRAIATLISEIKNSSGAVSANRVGSTLSYLFRWAMNDGLAESNPAIGLNKFEERARERVLSDAELRAVWQAAGDDHFGSIIKLLVLTGQRAAEIGSLRWSEIQGDSIVLSGERTKNGEAHAIPLSTPALEILRKQPRRVNHDGATRQLVFGEGHGETGFTGWGHCKARLDARITQELRTPPPHWVVHDIRRTTATGMSRLGVLPHAIEMVLNHRSGFKAGVGGVYIRANYEAEKRDALTRWADHVMCVVAPGPASMAAE
jgi:integrase